MRALVAVRAVRALSIMRVVVGVVGSLRTEMALWCLRALSEVSLLAVRSVSVEMVPNAWHLNQG